MSQPAPDPRVRRQVIFAFMFFFAVLISVLRPEPTRGQLVFRLATGAIGLVGFIAVSRRRPQ